MNELHSGINTCCHYELSFIVEKENKIYFPSYFLEDYFIDFFEDNDIKYFYEDDNKASVYKNETVSWNLLYIVKTESYSAINWYENLKEFTYKSELIEIKNIENIKTLLKHINFPKFIKLDDFSCKDTDHSGIFKNAIEVENIFKKSMRILNTLNQQHITKSHYLFVREPDYFINEKEEVRCFIYQRRLVAVSNKKKISDKIKLELEEFVKKIILQMPYMDAVIDIFIDSKKHKFILIEVNNFGADSPCGSGLFNWKEDYALLHGQFDYVFYAN